MIRWLLHHVPIAYLPIPEYYKTRMWSATMRPPRGRVAEWPYHRCVELATRAFAGRAGYGTAFPGAGNPASSYSMLEFGVANGRTFQLMLHFRDVWLRRMNLKNRVVALGFDTFEGLPPPREGDDAAPWQQGDYRGNNEEVQRYLEGCGFRDFTLVRGLFRDTLAEQEELLRRCQPVFVAVDCDYYSSTIDIFDALLPELAPHGCMFYFDDVSVDFYSDLTGELKAIAEVNSGRYGKHIQLADYPLWIETGEMRHYKQVYRLVNLEKAKAQVVRRGIDPASPPGRLSPSATSR
jgi:hypothetical protein